MSQAASSDRPSLARCVGQAVGIVWSALRTPVTPKAVEVGRRTETLEQGGMTLRRTTIDEVVMQPPPQTH
jgi:hypothetical protein